MTNEQEKIPAFISYAWGGPYDKKDWLRSDIITNLEGAGFSVFWDRDSIPIGHSIFQEIENTLNKAPLNVICICDSDYIASANKENSGLHVELEMLQHRNRKSGVKIIPVIIEESISHLLPQPLAGRLYVDLISLHKEGITLGPTVTSAVLGASQSQIRVEIAARLREAAIWEKARLYFQHRPYEIHGEASSHRVFCSPGELLLPPRWMYKDPRWSYRVLDCQDKYHPAHGIWHWDWWTPGASMCTLGAAICSAFFPHKWNECTEDLIKGGEIIAQRIVSFVKSTEPLDMNWSNFVQVMLSDAGSMEALERLLS
ncbi:TIR domain protein [Burkholderia thailandensis E264]|uniref:toll/interleukin-1 receptor domain-containing protein n=1 Tax=Burkholderia TaxID=32008 RepID=UPI0003EC915A|nr:MULTISPECIES: toll/interleukin-1 receptor domain-containing protein [Burkholderia]AHI72177.1 TIR domain protein [Burkholderia thailandensis 2002721723]AIP27173.1 TIR domain protein [Burkholderia thailandensis E264]AJX99422.1 TIR domain protein [Burkholderia thailandensis 2002721643]MBR8190553.1 toll/interleukin-1 receptor domain-containing protein [Burkholderia vietnamiensis]NBC94627.1 TIR domain-containing protein [Burkholderia thailandensis]